MEKDDFEEEEEEQKKLLRVDPNFEEDGHFDEEGYYILKNGNYFDADGVFVSSNITTHPKYQKEGNFDAYGFYVMKDGDFFDQDGYYFNTEGYDQHGGYYDKEGNFFPGLEEGFVDVDGVYHENEEDLGELEEPAVQEEIEGSKKEEVLKNILELPENYEDWVVTILNMNPQISTHKLVVELKSRAIYVKHVHLAETKGQAEVHLKDKESTIKLINLDQTVNTINIYNKYMEI